MSASAGTLPGGFRPTVTEQSIRARDRNEDKVASFTAVETGPFSFVAGAILASLADSLADGPTPPWLVRVGACLGCHFATRNLRMRPGRPGLLL